MWFQTWSCLLRTWIFWAVSDSRISQFSSVQLLSRVQFFATPWITARQASLSITNSRSSLGLTSIESVMPSSHLILCHLLFLLPPIPPSIRVFSNESTLLMRWPKSWSFRFSIISSKEHPRPISFRMDWLDLLAVQGTLKSLLQHHSSKAAIVRCSAFFTVQHSHPYMTTGKTIALTRWTFVGKVMSLPLNMLSRLVITFLPRSKRLLMSWLQYHLDNNSYSHSLIAAGSCNLMVSSSPLINIQPFRSTTNPSFFISTLILARPKPNSWQITYATS